MTAPGTPAPVVVIGGAGGIDANRAAIEHLAGVYGTAACALSMEVFALESELHRVRGAAPLAAGPATVDPAGLVLGEQLLGEALAGVRAARTGTAALARNLGNAANGYPWGEDVLDVALLDRVGSMMTSLQSLPGLGWTQGGTIEGHGSLANGGDDRVAGWDPGLVDAAVAGTDPAALGTLLSPGADGRGVAVPTGSTGVTAPRSLPDLISALGDVDRTGTPGGIDVRILDGPGGRKVIVDITGTRSWWVGGANVADLPTNERALTGRSTAYEQGVLAALRHAGVRRDDDVMLVGHSQGGMIAVNAARTAVRTGAFRVTHVITAGAPVGLTAGRLPGSVRLLALENPRDLVPRLDGQVNPDRRNVTTVLSPHGDGTVGGNHSIDDAYGPLARDTQADGSRSVRDFLTSAAGFLRAEQAVAHSYRIERR